MSLLFCRDDEVAVSGIAAHNWTAADNVAESREDEDRKIHRRLHPTVPVS